MKDSLQNESGDVVLREHLRRAVRSEAPPPFLEARIRNTIGTTKPNATWAKRLIPVAAALCVCLGVTIGYQLGHLRLTTASQESYLTSVANQVARIMRVGLADHIHCSVFRKFPKDAPKVEDLAARLGPEYSGVIPIVRKNLPGNYRLMIAHHCGYHDRKFVHLSLKSESRLVSLVIARKEDGESFLTEGLIPALTRSGIPFYRAGVQRFETASFETANYLVYFVSDLGQSQNMQMMLAMAPQLKELLRKLEG